MENTNQLNWRPIYVAYALIALSILLLFFTGMYEAGFGKWLADIGVEEIIAGLNYHNVLLFVLDASLLVVAFAPLDTEDERTEKIRAFALKNAFLFGMSVAVCIGLFLSASFNMLVYAAFILVYYIVLFRLCLYRDPVIVYMTDDQLKQYGRKKMRKFNIYLFVQLGIGAAVGDAVASIYHRPELNWYVILLNLYLIVLIRTVYYSYKG